MVLFSFSYFFVAKSLTKHDVSTIAKCNCKLMLFCLVFIYNMFV